MLKILLVDDEVDALEVLEWKLKRYVSDVEIVSSSSPKKALDIVRDFCPHVVFLDIQMPEMDGFSFLEKAGFRDFSVIFTTAHDEFALKAIKASAVDYLLKPIDKIELIEAVEKVRIKLDKENIGHKLETVMQSIGKTCEKINITADGKIYLLDKDDVVMLQSDKSYTTIYLKCDKTILVSKTLKEVEKKFEYNSFFRVHNSFLVNLDHVKEYMKRMGGELVLTNGLTASVSRNKKAELLERLQLTK
ncbi:LytR/AlgR family response regulator transcription factor [Flavicella sediminum]|uniref:LytR/AlgR family response regulator transcription factor n=1 Tax=Flavicella sediminum TaxID=2585141 RepID=UPI0011202AD8|nr:LytTR family DNA-binding domain-containing protein [Flavicella sediminum]